MKTGMLLLVLARLLEERPLPMVFGLWVTDVIFVIMYSLKVYTKTCLNSFLGLEITHM